MNSRCKVSAGFGPPVFSSSAGRNRFRHPVDTQGPERPLFPKGSGDNFPCTSVVTEIYSALHSPASSSGLQSALVTLGSRLSRAGAVRATMELGRRVHRFASTRGARRRGASRVGLAIYSVVETEVDVPHSWSNSAPLGCPAEGFAPNPGQFCTGDYTFKRRLVGGGCGWEPNARVRSTGAKVPAWLPTSRGTGMRL